MRFVVVTGMSGSGKRTAMKMLRMWDFTVWITCRCR